MVSLQKAFERDEGLSRSFEDIYKASYSHGLESIYALEYVDIKSVRKIPVVEAPVQLPLIKQGLSASPSSPQLEFDFGESFRDWMRPFIYREPIDVLNLSQQAERCLISHEKRLLGSLIHTDLRQLVFLKGMGQGYLDEISHKLQEYLKGRELQRTRAIDFAGWVRSLCASGVTRKKLQLCLERYQLAHLFRLSTTEGVEIKKLSPRQRTEWEQAGFAELAVEEKRKSVYNTFETVSEVFIKPWIQRRLGVATREEIEERIERISVSAGLAQHALNFFSEVYFKGASPLSQYLCEVENGVYCADQQTKQGYETIVSRALSYLYKPTVYYPLHSLITLLSRELAREWLGFADAFISKVLHFSSRFKVRKGSSGQLEVRLS